jgi:hypothetical protein
VGESPAERAARKARKLRARLGEEGPAPLGSPPPPRPLRMRAYTYARLLARLREAEERAWATLAGMAAGRLAMPSGRGEARREGRLKQVSVGRKSTRACVSSPATALTRQT